LYLNAQSIVKKVDELQCVANLTRPDLILVTESWCNDSISNAFLSIDQYELQPELRVDRGDTAGGRGGGLLVYARTGLAVLKFDSGVSFHQHIVFKVRDVKVYLIYRSPNAPPEAMAGLAALVRGADSSSIFIGDFNLPDVNWTTGEHSPRTAELMDAVADAAMEQLVSFSTQVRGNVLDLVLTNIPERVRDISDEGRLASSDHTMLKISVEVGPLREVVKEVRNWRRADWDGMRRQLAATDWRRELRGKPADRMWEAFKNKVHGAVRRFVPTRKVKNDGRPAWMKNEILAALRRKKKLWQRAKGGRGVEEYKEQEKLVKNMIKKAKRQFEKKLAEGGSSNKKPFFAYVKRKTRTRQGVGPLRGGDGRVVTDDTEMAEVLNSFFSSVFTREDLTDIPPAAAGDSVPIERMRITEWEIKKAIRKLKKESAAGPDEIGPRLLQELEGAAATALTMIFRESVESGVVPEDWRRANVTPIFKKGTKMDPGNYRPVSLTSVCCKLLEGLMKTAIMRHLEVNNLVNPSQHGFMAGRSCCTNLLEFMEEVTRAVDEGVPVDVIYLDFAKAFDKVPKERLLEKLRAHGVRGHLLRWIRNWLTGRQQRVVLNGKKSGWEQVLSGVPQGSVLGPLLFLIFINDLDIAARKAEILKKFADDTKLGGRVSTEEERAALQEALDELCVWAATWGMDFNVKKCKVLHIGHNNIRHVYTMGGQPLGETEEETDVGVLTTANLKPAAQCRRAARTAAAVLGQISRAFHYRDRHVFVQLYKQYVRPHLEFAAAAWSPWQEGDKACLERIQQRAVAMVSGLTSRDYEDRLKELHMETLEERRHQMDMAQVHKILTGKDKVDAERLLTLANSHGRNTRAAADARCLRQNPGRLEVRRNFFTQRVVAPWNDVPSEIKHVSSVQAFKSTYRQLRRERVPAA
jgi:hypothetical protein